MCDGIGCSRLISPCSSLPNTTTYSRNNSACDPNRTLKDKKKVDWLGISGLKKRHQIEFLDFLFAPEIWHSGLRRALQVGTAKKHRKQANN